jgi:hypothetical protein
MPFHNLTKLNPALHIIIMSGSCAALLSGCGIRGTLQAPPPVFGTPTADAERIPEDTPERRDPVGGPSILDDETLVDPAEETAADTSTPTN